MCEKILPEGWSNCTLADIAEVNPKKIVAEQDLNAGFVPMSHAPTNYNGKLEFEEKTWSEIAKSYTNFKNGDVIFAKVTPCFENGKAAIVKNMPNGIGAGSSEFYVLRARNKEIPANYLLGIIKTKKFMQEGAANMTGAVGLRRVPRAFVENFPLMLPPVAEQQIIADKLETLLAQVDSIKARLEKIPQILKYFRQAVLSASISGNVARHEKKYKSVHVEDFWSHDVIGLDHWKQFKFSDIVKIVGGSQPPKSDFKYEMQDGYIRLIQIRDYKNDNNKVFIPLSKAKRFVEKNDVMIGRYGPPIFQILKGLEGAYNVALMKAVPKAELLDNDYLYWLLQNYKLYNFIEAGSDRTAGQSGVNKKHLESYPILLPTIQEQQEIVRCIEQLFSYADTIEEQVNNALERVNNLTQSILAKAFRGELTAQWRAENPDLISGKNDAQTLLAQIQQQHSSTKTIKRSKGNS